MKKLIILLFFISFWSGVLAQDITGAWYGQLNVPGAKLILVFHFAKQGNTYTATMDSPNQGATGLPVDGVTFVDNTVTIIASKFGISYTGVYRADSSRITGTFMQGQGKFPLVLTKDKLVKLSDEPQKARPQDPVDFPYLVQEVSFNDVKAGCTLAGTLTLPKDGKASRVVIMITGSGPQNRNEEIFNHRPFLVWANWLTRHGIGVLRYDDRGVAKSTGKFETATTAGFADDAEAAVNYLLSRPDTKTMDIGLIGHSEGGIIAPMVAARNKNVGFIILLAGPGVPLEQLVLRQQYDIGRLSGLSAETLTEGQKKAKPVYDYLNANPQLDTSKLRSGLIHLFTQDLPAGSKLPDGAQQQMAVILTPWFRYLLGLDPAVYLEKVSCPVLAVNGTLDMQVNAAANLAAIKAALTRGGNKNFSIVPLDSLNHLLQKAKTGAATEYDTIDETIDPLALTTVLQWIKGLK